MKVEIKNKLCAFIDFDGSQSDGEVGLVLVMLAKDLHIQHHFTVEEAAKLAEVLNKYIKIKGEKTLL